MSDQTCATSRNGESPTAISNAAPERTRRWPGDAELERLLDAYREQCITASGVLSAHMAGRIGGDAAALAERARDETRTAVVTHFRTLAAEVEHLRAGRTKADGAVPDDCAVDAASSAPAIAVAPIKQASSTKAAAGCDLLAHEAEMAAAGDPRCPLCPSFYPAGPNVLCDEHWVDQLAR